MGYKRYERYKDSGVEWIGEVPEGWDLYKITWIFNLISSGTTPPTANIEYYDGNIPWINTGDLNDGYIFDTPKTVTKVAFQECSALKLFPVNTLLIAMYGATIGKTGITKIVAATNQACCALAKPSKAVPKFIFYWFLSNRNHIISMAYGGGQPNISQNLIKSLRIPLPKIEEQKNIVCFLDQKTVEIDNLIADKEKMVQLLQEMRQAIISEAVTEGLDKNVKMKDSGVEWIGEIPEHWEVKRLKYLVWLIVEKASEDDIDKPYIGLENIEAKIGRIKFYANEEESFTESDSLLFEPNDILFGKLRPYLAKCIVADFYGRCTSELLILRCRSIISNYLYYFMLSDMFIKTVNSSTYGAKMPRANWSYIGNLKVVLPDTAEQKHIINYINKKTNIIDSLISDIRTQITKLKEYRQSLISEAVTGKINVRNFMQSTEGGVQNDCNAG